MFRNLRLKKQPELSQIEPRTLTIDLLAHDSNTPITLFQINSLSEPIKSRIYRNLLPPSLVSQFNIDPITWKSVEGGPQVRLKADTSKGLVNISMRFKPEIPDDFFCIELADNSFNSIDLNLIVLNDPRAPKYHIDVDEDGNQTMFGTLRRNVPEEERAKRDNLAPGQVRRGLHASGVVLEHIETFLGTLGHRALFLEPLTYVSAWIFERYGFAYVRGHKLLDDIHREFQPSGKLYRALDNSTMFRQPDQWCSVRGRAWAIHDGILDVLNTRWNEIRMVKQVGRHAGVSTFPEAVY